MKNKFYFQITFENLETETRDSVLIEAIDAATAYKSAVEKYPEYSTVNHMLVGNEPFGNINS